MLQLAMPIEPGNSGGPLLDRSGHVHGIVNAKSLLTQNLGFATPANHLKALLKQPNPWPWIAGCVRGLSTPTSGNPFWVPIGARKAAGF